MGIRIFRWGLPAAIAITGAVLMGVGEGRTMTAAGLVLIGVAGLVALANAFARLSISSQDDREREERARERRSRRP